MWRWAHNGPRHYSCRETTSLLIEGGADDSRHVINSDLLLSLRRGPLPDRDDVEVAVGLARLVHDELKSYGTSGGGR